jgi:hypothetical protein
MGRERVAMAFHQCEAKTKKGNQCKNGAMSMSKYCGPHTDSNAGGTVTRRTVDLVETLRFHASKPNSPDFYALAADELLRLRSEVEMLRKRLYRRSVTGDITNY